MGQVLTAGQGQNPARQAAMAAGIPQEIPAWGVNQVCGSGLRSVASAVQPIMNGDANIVIAGGQERSEEHTSELQSLMRITYAVLCLQKHIHHKDEILALFTDNAWLRYQKHNNITYRHTRQNSQPYSY